LTGNPVCDEANTVPECHERIPLTPVELAIKDLEDNFVPEPEPEPIPPRCYETKKADGICIPIDAVYEERESFLAL